MTDIGRTPKVDTSSAGRRFVKTGRRVTRALRSAPPEKLTVAVLPT